MKVKGLKLKQLLFLITCFFYSVLSFSQTVDLVADVAEDAPFTNGQNITYTLQAVAGTTVYAGLSVKLVYDPAIIQVNTITPVYNFEFQQDDISQPGTITFSGGDLGSPFISETITVFTLDITVLDASQTILITHDFDDEVEGTQVADTSGNNVLGDANDIVINPNGTVDLVANVNTFPPYTNGQTITYTLNAVAGGTIYTGLTVKLLYNPAVIQLNSLTPIYNFDFQQDDTSVPGVIEFSGGDLGSPFITGTITAFTADFTVLDASQTVTITHDYSDTDKTQVVDTNGMDILDDANDIILETLSTKNTNFLESLTLFPNPVSDVLVLKSSNNHNILNIEIYDIMGRLVKAHENNITTNKIEMNVSTLQASSYIMLVTSTSLQKVKLKFVKQ